MQTQRRSHVETEAETGGTRPPAQGRLEPPELEEAEGPSLEPVEGAQPRDTWMTSDIWSAEWRE